MKRLFIAAFGIVALAGCTSVRHAAPPFQPAGSSFPVEVAVRHKAGASVQGTVHYRTSGAGPYRSASLQNRGRQLWTMLPTETLQAEDTIEYYIDVNVAGDLYTLGSPGSPYTVRFLHQDDLIMTNVRDRVIATDASHPVRIVLLAAGQPIDQPVVSYQLPGVPGDVRAPMQADARGNYQLRIGPEAVTPGSWKYAIEVPLNGTVYRFPRSGYRSFTVRAAVIAAPQQQAAAADDGEH